MRKTRAGTKARRVTISLPENLLAKIDSSAGKRHRSEFLAAAALSTLLEKHILPGGVYTNPTPPALPTRKIAILGTTPSRMEGPIDDKSWEIWTIGPGGKDSHRWNRLFETHGVWPLEFGAREKPEDKSYLDDLSKVQPPQTIYTIKHMPTAMEQWAHGFGRDEKWLRETITGDWKTNVVIDSEALYVKYCRMMFQSSIDYCIAMAIEEGATDIGCWGIDLESGEEYISQWFSAKVWLMLARLAGVNIHLPAGSGLERDITPYPNRYETHLALTLEKKWKWLENLIAQSEPQYEAKRADLNRLEGRLLTLRDFSGPQEAMQKTEQEMIQSNAAISQMAANLNHLKGELSATNYYRRMYCWGMNEPT